MISCRTFAETHGAKRKLWPFSRPFGGFTLIELLVVIAIIAILASLLLPALSSAKQKGQRAACLSNLKQIHLAFNIYLDEHEQRFPDVRSLKNTLPGGYKPWSDWPASDPRAGWAAVILSNTAPQSIWSCGAAVASAVGNAVQVRQAIDISSNAPATRYWMWRFDRPDDPINQEDFWGKTVSQCVADLKAANDPLLGQINGPADVELVVDAYFPNTVPAVAPALKGHAIHPKGRNRAFLDGHAEFFRDNRTPL